MYANKYFLSNNEMLEYSTVIFNWILVWKTLVITGLLEGIHNQSGQTYEKKQFVHNN